MQLSENNFTVKKIFINSILVKNKNKNLLLIIDSSYQKKFFIGEKIFFNGEINKIEEKNSFYYFLVSHKTLYYSYAKDFYVDDNIKFSLRNIIIRNLSYSEENLPSLVLLLFFGIKNNNNFFIYNFFNDLNLTFLIVFSGIHLNFLEKFFKIFPQKYQKNIFLSFVLLLSYLLYFPIPITRFFLTKSINKKKMNNFNSLGLSGIILMFFNPLIVFNFSFIFSFYLTFIIYLIIEKSKNKLNNLFLISITSFCFVFPFVYDWDSSICITSPFISIIISPIILLLYLIVFVTLPLHFLWGISYSLILFLLNITFFISNILSFFFITEGFTKIFISEAFFLNLFLIYFSYKININLFFLSYFNLLFLSWL